MPLAKPAEIVTALRDYRLTVVEWPGWKTRGTGYPFHPYAQAWHHDAFQETFGDEAAARFMAEQGRPDLRPPLCNGSIGNFGTVYLLAYGNANHAGRNEADVHLRLKDGKAPRGDAKADPDGDTIVGNPYLWGWESRNAGTGHDPWDQLDVMMRAGAAMADCCGWSAMASAGHRELTARKPDPVGFDMTAFRAGIARAQAAHNAPPPQQEDDDMAYIITNESPTDTYKDAGPTLILGNKRIGLAKGEDVDAWTKAGAQVVPMTGRGYTDIRKGLAASQ